MLGGPQPPQPPQPAFGGTTPNQIRQPLRQHPQQMPRMPTPGFNPGQSPMMARPQMMASHAMMASPSMSASREGINPQLMRLLGQPQRAASRPQIDPRILRMLLQQQGPGGNLRQLLGL